MLLAQKSGDLDFANETRTANVRIVWTELLDLRIRGRKKGLSKTRQQASSKAKNLNKVREIFPSSGAMLRMEFRVCQGESRAD
jgi:hypothetical protein